MKKNYWDCSHQQKCAPEVIILSSKCISGLVIGLQRLDMVQSVNGNILLLATPRCLRRMKKRGGSSEGCEGMHNELY